MLSILRGENESNIWRNLRKTYLILQSQLCVCWWPGAIWCQVICRYSDNPSLVLYIYGTGTCSVNFVSIFIISKTALRHPEADFKELVCLTTDIRVRDLCRDLCSCWELCSDIGKLGFLFLPQPFLSQCRGIINELGHHWFAKISTLEMLQDFWSVVGLFKSSGPRLNIKTVLSRYGDFHVKDKTAVRTSYL